MRHKRLLLTLFICILSMSALQTQSSAVSLNLDSVAAWGKFPNFCVKTYRWGDKFFNTYDSTYVVGTGYKFNVKFKSNAWLDNYIFALPDNYRMHMASEMNVSGGVHLTYLAVSVGYDYNLMRLFSKHNTARKKFNFGFNCALFAADLYWVTNDVGTRITSYGHPGDRVECSIPFYGIDNSIFGVDVYYFFNNKRYSRAAAFNYSKHQKVSSGSWILGFSYWTQSFDFNFSSLSDDILMELPAEWAQNDWRFRINNHNYAIRGGYGYNLVLPRNWLIGISETPVIGLKHGTVNGELPELSVSLYNRLQVSGIWSNKKWFAGLIVKAENGVYFDKKQTLLNGVFSGELSVGYRFNLW